jgi:hypothetical protein
MAVYDVTHGVLPSVATAVKIRTLLPLTADVDNL